MLIKKITTGFVIQTWDTEKLIFTSQEFVAGDQVDYEDEKGQYPFNDSFEGEIGYLPFDMKQP